MGRSRLRLELLRTPKARRTTYETRRKGLEKKARELSTLCGVDVCLITYPPPLNKEEIKPFVWSNDPAKIANLIECHKLSSVEDECSRSRTCDLAWFYKDRTRKIEEEIEKVKKTIREVKYPTWDEQYGSLSEEELRMLVGVLTAKVESTKDTIKLLKERKAKSSFLMNPRIDENLDSSLGTIPLVQHPLPTYFNAQSYLENQQRMMMMMMMINNSASFSGNNPYDHTNYQINNVMNSASLMSYDVQNVANSVPGYGQHQLMISSDYFPQMYPGFNPIWDFDFMDTYQHMVKD